MSSKSRKRPSTPVRRSKRLKLVTDQSDNGDDGNTVQESQCTINDLPVECIQKIISYLPGRHWPRLELVNRKLRGGVLASWRCLKEVHLNEYSEKKVINWLDDDDEDEDEDADKKSLLSILRMIQTRSPAVQTIDGFTSFSYEFDSDIMEEMAKFETLKAVTFLDCDFLVKDLAAFLANSRSRTSLEELYITSSALNGWQYHINHRMEVWDEEAIRQALIDVEGRPGLRLKAFHYAPKNRCYPNTLLSALDVSQLERVSITEYYFKEFTVPGLLGRCTQLKELAIAMDSELFASTKTVLSALKSLPSPNLRKLEFYTRSYDFCDEDTIEALKELAQRCPKVEVLNIRGNNADETLNVIGECFSDLKELNIGVCKVSKEAFAGLMIRMGQLEKLGLHFLYGKPGTRMMSGIIVAMAMNTDSVTSLHLDLPLTLTKNAMSKLERMKLKELSVKFRQVKEGTVAVCQRLGPMMVSVDFGKTKINDERLVAALENKKMSQVRRISLKDTSITDLSLCAIGDSCPLLEELNIDNCEKVTVNGIRGMIEKCKKLTRLKVYYELPGLRDLIRYSPVNIET